MVILGELTSESTVNTAYQEFYASMIKTPYLGSSIPVILPALVVLFSIVFAGLSVFKLKNKALTAFKKVGSEDEKKKDQKEELSLFDNILKGERAMLTEIDINRKKEDRKKLLRFNQPQNADISISSKKDVPKVLLTKEEDLKRSLLKG